MVSGAVAYMNNADFEEKKLVNEILHIVQCSSSYSFHFRHLSFNGIMKKANSSQNITNPIGFYMYIY